MPVRWELAEGWGPVQQADSEPFEVALLLKIVPVVRRRQPGLLDLLARVPARKLLVTGSRQAMVKHTSIERREHAVIREFAVGHGLEIVRPFETEDEVGWLFGRE